jgi:predicted nucleic acid-binding protein
VSVVVDTSVWINVLNGNWTAAARLFRALVHREEILVGDLVVCEVLQGLRNEAEAVRVERSLRQFVFANVATPALAIRAAANYRRLRGRGITIRSTIDLLIGTYCIDNDHLLLHEDRDFDVMAAHLGLQTVRPTGG